jgi:hypothetical protein
MSELQNEITSKDIMYILNNPWEKLKGSWKLSNKSELQETLQYVKNLLKSSQLDGYYKIWKTPDNNPIAIIGGYKIGDKKYKTYFVTSKHMDKYGMKLSFDIRKILKELSVQFRGCSFSHYVEADNTDRISWFLFLGLKYKSEGNIGNTRYFEYISPEI